VPEEESTAVAKIARIPTPMNVRWQRMQYQLLPLLTVVFCSVLAWRLWHAAPHVTAVGQVNAETTEARSPEFGYLEDPPAPLRAPRLFDAVAAGQVVARVARDAGGAAGVDLVAPVAGQVVEIHRRTGQSVGAGQAVFTIAADHGRSITAYLRGDLRGYPEPGMPVAVRPRAGPADRAFRSVVERVGPQYQPVPAAQLRNNRAQEWGLPVMIPIPPEAFLRPGELVFVDWLASPPSGSATASNSAGTNAVGKNNRPGDLVQVGG
jgi:hypothetical protein